MLYEVITDQQPDSDPVFLPGKPGALPGPGADPGDGIHRSGGSPGAAGLRNNFV